MTSPSILRLKEAQGAQSELQLGHKDISEKKYYQPVKIWSDKQKLQDLQIAGYKLSQMAI